MAGWGYLPKLVLYFLFVLLSLLLLRPFVPPYTTNSSSSTTTTSSIATTTTRGGGGENDEEPHRRDRNDPPLLALETLSVERVGNTEKEVVLEEIFTIASSYLVTGGTVLRPTRGLFAAANGARLPIPTSAPIAGGGGGKETDEYARMEAQLQSYSSDDRIEAFWQTPEAAAEPEGSSSATWRGVLLVFHGCRHTGLHWFLLPEERDIVALALQRRFVVVAFQALESCWESATDLNRVQTALNALLEAHPRWKPLPLYALGVSSGGVFVTDLQQKIKLAAMTVMIAPPSRNFIPSPKVPPTLFVYMAHDKWASKAVVKEAADSLEEEGVETRVLECPPRPFTLSTLERLTTFSLECVESLHKRLVAAGLVAETDDRLRMDPRNFNWRNVLGMASKSGAPKGGCPRFSVVDVKSLEELLNVCFASHEITSQHAVPIMEFFESHHGVVVA